MANKLQFKRANSAVWKNNANYILEKGEPAFIIDENELRIGDGNTPFSELQPIGGKPWETYSEQYNFTDNIISTTLTKLLSSEQEAIDDRGSFYELYCKIIFEGNNNLDLSLIDNIKIRINGALLTIKTITKNTNKIILTCLTHTIYKYNKDSNGNLTENEFFNNIAQAPLKYTYSIFEYSFNLGKDDARYCHNILGFDFFDNLNQSYIQI